jgi:hypothetical protein
MIVFEQFKKTIPQIGIVQPSFSRMDRHRSALLFRSSRGFASPLMRTRESKGRYI